MYGDKGCTEMIIFLIATAAVVFCSYGFYRIISDVFELIERDNNE